MIFPTTFNTLTIPTGAQPGTARIVIDSEGDLISYSDGFGTDGFFTEITGGAILQGPLNADGSADEADAGRIVYDNLSPAHMTIESPLDPDNNVNSNTRVEIYGSTQTGTGLIDISNDGGRPVDLHTTGTLKVGSMEFGSVAITPSAPNTPTSATVTGLSLTGTQARGYATAANQAVGTQVTGVGVTGISLSGMTVWATRTNTTPLTVEWLMVSS